MPASAMAAAGYIDARIDFQLWRDDWLTAVKPDVVVFQRQIETAQIEAMQRVRDLLPNAFLVYEIDDALSQVPPTSHHYGAVPPGVNRRIKQALEICDAATVTTEALASTLRDLGGKDVRVIPNLLPSDKMRDREPHRGKGKIRVGFAGGISHGGDLRLIEPAMAAIGTEVEWVFFGCRPNSTVPYEFHDGVSPMDYQDKLFSLNLDLALAPLESNSFNACKSNLRLIESAACSMAVIAQHCDGYALDAPPVFAFAEYPEQWTEAIQRFVASPLSKRRQSGTEMRRWAAKHYTYEGRIEDRVRAWMPSAWPALFRPTSVAKPGGVVVCTEMGVASVMFPTDIDVRGVHQTLEDAAAQAMTEGCDLMWIRPGTTMEDAVWKRLVEAAAPPDVGSACAFANDGSDAFPTTDRFTPMRPDLAQQISMLVASAWPGRQAELPAPCGPVVLVKAHALCRFGSPDAAGMDGNVEAALTEWAARTRGFRHIQVLDRFIGALAGPKPVTEAVTTRLRLRGALEAVRAHKATLTAVERETLELRLITRNYSGPRPGMAPFAGDYATWAALRREGRFRMAENAVVAAFGAPLPDAEWLLFIDETVTLRPAAIAAMIDKANEHGAKVCYADHEVEDENGLQPVLKPDFDRELFLATDYVTPVCVVHRSVAEEVNRSGLPCRAALYRVLLSGHQPSPTRDYPDRLLIAHLPEVMATVTPSEDESDWTRRRALIVSEEVAPAVPHPRVKNAVLVQRKLTGASPKVTVIITTRGDGWLLQPCLLPLLHLTDYPNYDVILVHNHPTMKSPDIGWAALELGKRVRVLTDRGDFNWSRLNNLAVDETDAELLLFLNDDIRVTERAWLRRMVATCLQPDVGIVGARLLFGHGTVQHVGVVAHEGMIGHVHTGLSGNSAGYLGTAMLTHENSAVTGACMLIKRDMFKLVGGFREELSHNYNDIAFCLDARELFDTRIITECTAELIHLGGASRPGAASEEGAKRLIAENQIMGAEFREPDPYWNENFALTVHGLGIQGLNYESLVWRDQRGHEETVLIINDEPTPPSYTAAMVRSGATVYLADLSGFTLRMVCPALQSGTWDIRDRAAVQRMLDTLLIDDVVLCSLSGASAPAAPVESLRALKRLKQHFEYVPRNGEVVCPKLDFLQDGVDCGRGWEKGIGYCQACVDRYGSPFGAVDVEAWRTAWADIIQPIEESDAA